MTPDEIRKQGQSSAVGLREPEPPSPKGYRQTCNVCHERKGPTEFRWMEGNKRALTCITCETDEEVHHAHITDNVLTQEEEAKLWGNLSRQFLRGITKKEIDAMRVKDRIASASMAFDKRQILLNKPTAIHHIEDRRKLPELLEAMQAELERRARTIDVTPPT